MTAHPEYTQEYAHRQTRSQSLSLPPSFTLFLSFLHTKIHRSDKGRQQRHRKKTELSHRECACQLVLTSFSVSSKVWEAHKVLLPIWQHFQSQNTELGFLQTLQSDGSPSMLLSSLTLSVDTAHVSSQAVVLEIRIVVPGYTQSKGTVCSLLHFKTLCLPDPVTSLVLMRTWLHPVCVGRQRHTL